MSDSKVFMFPDGGTHQTSNDINSLLPLLMCNGGFDVYDKLPEDMVVYLRYNGRHFNHKLCDYAVSKMKCEDSSTGELVKLEPYNKDEVDAILHNYNIKLNNNDLYDYVYVANMCKADFFIVVL